ncbi:hypothetical protein BSL78_19818 [Apostichopus japonicus]|uniref:PDZ domain-containing protein n=1 Tax=Stichopus japonicus TaxID=307972 RepID=A0A2G8K5V1_STIJA|nr:hypothetical protein BSL78_19818 [Apostichopus japonicus]
MSAESCSVVRPTIPLIKRTEITCQPDKDIQSANIQNVERSELVTSSCDPDVLDVSADLKTIQLTTINYVEAEPEEENLPGLSSSSTGEENTGEDEIRDKVFEQLIIPEKQETLGRSKSPIDFVRDVGYSVRDAFDEAGHTVEYLAKKIINRQSLQNLAENNVHIIHPTTNQTIGFGLHLEEHRHGCHAARVMEDGLAFKSHLQCGDIIRKLNGFDLEGLKIEDIVKRFTEVDVYEKIILSHIMFDLIAYPVDHCFCRLLNDHGRRKWKSGSIRGGTHHHPSTVRRQHYVYSGGRGECDLSEIPIHDKVEVHHTDAIQRITKVPQSGRAEGQNDTIYGQEQIGISIFLTELFIGNFHMELYQGGSKHRRVCVIRNKQSSHILDHDAGNSTRVEAKPAPNPNSNVIKNPDAKFYYWYSHPEFPEEDVFESVTKKNHFIQVTENNVLVVRKCSSASQVAANGRFRVINAK